MRIRHIVFRLGGVLYPDLASAVLSFPDRTDIGETSLLRIHELAGLLAPGKITKGDFLDKVCGLCEIHCSPETLESHILHAGMHPDMTQLLDELSSRFRLSLLVDYPHCWLEQSSGWKNIRKYFPEKEYFYINDLGLDDEVDIFSTLIERDLVRPGASLLIDHDPSRTAAILRAGLDAGIFVSPDRLRRDFGLWSIVPFNQGES